ncbi:MAG: PilT/PilU family type 4a pilus ATPase [Nitrospiraceae bacterium]|nr:MAG: PilT/PilU family type 4a pilus ATPase [Nitrospiraceae bacterium]
MSTIVDVFNNVIAEGVKKKASDIHICVGCLWKYRIDGHILPLDLKPITIEDGESIVRHIISKSPMFSMDKLDGAVEELRDMDCSYTLAGVARFRVNICRQRGSFSIVLRVVPFIVPTIESLGLPEVISKIAAEERGLILVTGITGSGKSTTLASMINLINQNKPCKIVSIEDPIEYLHNEVKASIIQREVGFDTDSFATALRAALRQDPDVILVGEMRDTITIEIALKAAETGHLVLSTLHTMDAPKTIHRIISAFDLSEQQAIRIRLADALKAVISQRLLRRKDNAGRVAVLEIMRTTLTIKECIENTEKSNSIKDFIGSGRDQYGMQTFDQHLMDLFTQDVIDLETAKAAATSASDFERNIMYA